MHILVIDDERAVREILAEACRQAGYSVDEARNCTEAASKLVRGDVDLALCDIKMPDGNGVDLMRSIKESGIETNFIMVTAFASMESAVEALRLGASDYVTKPFNVEEMLHRVQQIAALRGLREENRVLRKITRADSDKFRFTSPSMAAVERLAGKVAPTDSTVLITGESGTGKGVLARLIHEQSRRSEHLFLPVNCSAIPETLMEAEFFGHTKGAFTGADKARKGLFLQADLGTLFLDEVGELPMLMQTKLLHAIEEKEIRAVGSEQSRRVDCRIIAATNRDLSQMVKEGTFREDLFFRLSMFHIHIPPLRERKEDIRALIRFVLDRARDQRDAATCMTVSDEVERLLVGYPWPGNVRQMENVINRACILAEDNCITLDDLPPEIARTVSPGSVHGTRIATQRSLRDQLREFEASVIYRTLDETGSDRRTAAQKLGIGLSSLYRKLEEFEAFGIHRSEAGTSNPARAPNSEQGN
ncbi:sigma-54-dependent transcriptional regulator [Aromatoleum petrolei]|uniref:Response regulator n=1 Tax=Aromatoleum petrolei TaxID=76116 RepID=A0ABX1MMR0_9RHOO|nr:sigma-54 dependent transcriptional regulator [Aromatoleum petrolei]NMF88491.1 response regulator [Aromatoleum petrolei]QTQ36932.1 Two component system response regulator, sigma54-specific [Aromatoleum petrolei]